MYEGDILRAVQLVSLKHKDQKRKVFEYPYISHLLMVFHMVTLYSDDEKVHIAALLHDIVEDTDYSLMDVERNFGKEVARYVAELTEDKDLGWRERKEQYREQLSVASENSILIKSADLICNLQDCLFILNNYSLHDFESMGLNEYWINVNSELVTTLRHSYPNNPLIDKVEEILSCLRDTYLNKKTSR